MLNPVLGASALSPNRFSGPFMELVRPLRGLRPLTVH